MKILTLFFILLTTVAMQCEKSDVKASSPLDGEWVVKGVFLGDAIDTPCGYENPNSPEMTIVFPTDKKDGEKLSFSGKAAVNQFFGSYELISFDKSTNLGVIKMGVIGSTKMAGPEELMNCEIRFFSFLEQSVDFSVLSENGKDILRIGIFKKNTTPSRDGGTFLICERK